MVDNEISDRGAYALVGYLAATNTLKTMRYILITHFVLFSVTVGGVLHF